MVRKLIVHKLHHILGDVVGCESGGQGQVLGSLLAEAATVFCVEVPFVAHWVFSVHQDTCFLAHFTVEKFKANLFAPGNVLFKCIEGAKKMGVVSDL